MAVSWVVHVHVSVWYQFFVPGDLDSVYTLLPDRSPLSHTRGMGLFF